MALGVRIATNNIGVMGIGVRVAEFTVVLVHETSSLKFGYESVPAPVFNEILEPTAKDVTVLAEYTSSYYAGRFAVSSRPIGKGRAVHFGAFHAPRTLLHCWMR